jgi:NADH-quinone oxidoreductase subunit E
MLDDKIKDEIRAEIGKHKDAQAACLEVLKIVQRHNRWVSDDNVREIAAITGLTEEEIDSLATCYTMIFRRPVGRNVILLCDSVTCWIMGYEKIREYLFMRLGVVFGQTTTDERFTVLPVACLGTCDKAPAMMVNSQLYTNLSTEAIDEILEQYK